MAQAVSIEGWSAPPSDDVLERMAGSVVNVCVGGVVGPGPTPFGEFFRFARVVGVVKWPRAGDGDTCPRCDETARYCLIVEWETGYDDPEGNCLCEYCVDGVVTAGAEAIPFGSGEPAGQGYEVKTSYDLTRRGRRRS